MTLPSRLNSESACVVRGNSGIFFCGTPETRTKTLEYPEIGAIYVRSDWQMVCAATAAAG